MNVSSIWSQILQKLQHLFSVADSRNKRQTARWNRLLDLFFVTHKSGKKFKVIDISYGGILIQFADEDHSLLDSENKFEFDLEFHITKVTARAKFQRFSGNKAAFSFLHNSNALLQFLRPILESIRLGNTIVKSSPELYIGEDSLHIKLLKSITGQMKFYAIGFTYNGLPISYDVEQGKLVLDKTSKLDSGESEIDQLSWLLALLLGVWQSEKVPGIEEEISYIYQKLVKSEYSESRALSNL